MEVKTLKEMEAEMTNELDAVVNPDNNLKEMFVKYVGEKKSLENGEVTLEMCIKVLADEFPEFIAPLAEHNFMLGYEKCEEDINTMINQNKEENND